MPEGHFYYGKAKVNVSILEDFLALGFGFFFAAMDRYVFPICIPYVSLFVASIL